MIAALIEEMLVEVDNRFATLCVRIWQPEKQEPRGTLFCVHGFTGNGGDFEYLAVFLAQNGYRVVCPDLIGRGRSSYFGDGAAYTMVNYVKCLQAVAKYRSRQNHFLGTSWGGMIAIIYLYMTRAPIDRVILNDVPMLGGGEIDALREQILLDARASFDDIESAQAYVRQTRAFLGPVEAAVFERYVAGKIIARDGGFGLAYDPATTAHFGALKGKPYSLFKLMGELKARFLMLYGRSSEFRADDDVAALRKRGIDIWQVNDVDAGHPPSMMTLQQALIVLGFLAAA